MTYVPDNSVPDDSVPDDPRNLLDEVRRLRAHTRRSGRSWWFPLTVFGVLVLASCPLYCELRGVPRTGTYRYSSVRALWLYDAFGGTFTPHPAAIVCYWLAALVTGFCATGLWYCYQGERAGLRRPVLAFVATGLAITAFVIGGQSVPVVSRGVFWVGLRGSAGVLIITIALLVLARLERSWVLAVIAVVANVAAVLATTYDVKNVLFRVGVPGSDWTQAAGMLLAGLVLLLTGLAAWAWSRPGVPRGWGATW